MGPDEVEPPAEVYAAIGEFVVRFSQMLHDLELMQAVVIAGGRDTGIVASVLAGRTAHPIITSYFALCFKLGDGALTDADTRAIKGVRREMLDLVAWRNRLAHDVWYVGWTSSSDDGTTPTPHQWGRDLITADGVESRLDRIEVLEIRGKIQDADRLRRIGGNLLGNLQMAHELRSETNASSALPPPVAELIARWDKDLRASPQV